MWPKASAQVNLPLATLKVVFINSSPAWDIFISRVNIFETSQSICSPIPFTVNGFAVNLTTGSIGLPTILPWPVGNKWILKPAAAWSVTHSAAAEEVSIKYKPFPLVGSSAGSSTSTNLQFPIFWKFPKAFSSIVVNPPAMLPAVGWLSESQPTAGNIAGGLTTIEEKAFGNFQKIGNCKFIDVLEPAEEPTKGKGLYFMDTSSAAAECVTLQAAAGFNIHLFPTGQGNIVGNPIEPVVKLTANPLTVKGMGEHIDCDVSKILSREMNMSEAGDKLIETTLRVANGRLTCAEALGHKEFVMTKLYRSA